MRLFLFIFVMAIAGFIVLYLLPDVQPEKLQETENPFPIEKVQKNVRNVTPDSTLPGPAISSDTISRLPAIIVPPVPKIVKKQNVMRMVVVVAAGILKDGDTRIHISNIKPLTLGAKCKGTGGMNWPCGRFARTALRALIGTRKISCEDFAPSQIVFARCKVGHRDIGGWLVLQGWAEDKNGHYLSQMKSARENEVGMWNRDGP